MSLVACCIVATRKCERVVERDSSPLIKIMASNYGIELKAEILSYVFAKGRIGRLSLIRYTESSDESIVVVVVVVYFILSRLLYLASFTS